MNNTIGPFMEMHTFKAMDMSCSRVTIEQYRKLTKALLADVSIRSKPYAQKGQGFFPKDYFFAMLRVLRDVLEI